MFTVRGNSLRVTTSGLATLGPHLGVSGMNISTLTLPHLRLGCDKKGEGNHMRQV
jgi:hypothetical protein